MFLIGETKVRVINGKLALPKEYHLKKRNLIARWKDNFTLYISDNNHSLNYAAGKDSLYFSVYIDSEDKITVPDKYENYIVVIKGCISAIELLFIQN